MSTGSTTNYNFPYPEQTDPVNVANDIKLLADSVDSQIDGIVQEVSYPMWTNGTFSNGVATPTYNNITKTMGLSLTQDLRSTASPSFVGLTVSASSSNTIVKITQTGSGNALLVEDEASTDSSPFVINAAGNVGIGLTSPTALLEIQDNTNTANLVIGGSGSANVMKVGVASGDSLAFYANTSEIMRITSGGSIGIGNSSPTTILDVTGTVTATAFNSTGTTITLNSATSGSPTNNAVIKVERGSSADVFIRWYETEGAWQFTNDGTNYENIGGGGLVPTFFLGGM